MKTLFIFVCLSPAFLFSQKKIQTLCGLSLNHAVIRTNSEDKDLNVKKVTVLGYYLSLGLKFNFDSTYLFYAGVRYGRENSRFRIEHQNQLYEFRTNNRPLSFIFAPGLKINKHNAFYLNLGITRVLYTNRGGGGVGQHGGKQYSYSYAENLARNSWELRPGLKWQIIPHEAKKFVFEFGFEPSLLTRNLQMEIKNKNPFLASKILHLRYDMLLFYSGIQF